MPMQNRLFVLWSLSSFLTLVILVCQVHLMKKARDRNGIENPQSPFLVAPVLFLLLEARI